MSMMKFSLGPASKSSTFQLGFSDKRFASIQPADPAPTIIKSYSFKSTRPSLASLLYWVAPSPRTELIILANSPINSVFSCPETLALINIDKNKIITFNSIFVALTRERFWKHVRPAPWIVLYWRSLILRTRENTFVQCRQDFNNNNIIIVELVPTINSQQTPPPPTGVFSWCLCWHVIQNTTESANINTRILYPLQSYKAIN